MKSPKSRDRHPALERLRTLSYLLDNSIPIPLTRYRIGLDPLLGLIPGGGDVVGAILSAYIVFEAARFGLPKETLIQMLGNLVTDATLGSLPFIGDLFDATWKANSRNLALLEAHARNPFPQPGANKGFIVLLIALLVLIVVGVGAIAALLVSAGFKLIGGR